MGYGLAIKLILAAALIAAAAYAVHSYNSAIEQAEKQKALAEKIAAERDGWIEVAAEQEAIAKRRAEAVKAREVDRARLQKERDDARESAAALRRDPIVATWANVDLPAAVIQRLRQLSGEHTAAEDRPRDPAAKPADDRDRATVRRVP